MAPAAMAPPPARFAAAVATIIIVIGCCCAPVASAQKQSSSSTPYVVPQTAKYDDGARPGSSASRPATYALDITAAAGAPDCFGRQVILVNGQFMPTLELTQGDYVEITVSNNIPSWWPAVTQGITIHSHGFSMHGFPFMDGTRFVSSCPIAPGSSFTYRYQVNEMPGTYFWHDHAAMYRADGLQGALIVRERPGTPALHASDGGDATLLLSDWWHFPGNSLAMRLSRPFDPSKANGSNGQWCWVGVPKSILINGRGNYYDCEDTYKRTVGSPLPFRPADKQVVAQAKDLMQPNACIAGQLGPTAEPPLCSITEGAKGPGASCSRQRTELELTPGKTHRLRLINAGMLVYMTVCFEKHTVTVVALDAAPVAPRDFKECVDVNTGQRVDVLIKADQPAGSFWVSVASQYRKGAPAGYAVMRYKGSSSSSGGGSGGGGSPDPASILQPGPAVERKWTTADMMGFTAPEALLSATSSSGGSSSSGGNTKAAATAAYVAPAVPGQRSWRLPKKEVDKRFVIQATQPIIEENGILRWALNSVAHSEAPPCRSLLSEVHESPSVLQQSLLAAGQTAESNKIYFTRMGGDAATWKGNGAHIKVVDAASSNGNLLNELQKPTAATHVLTLDGSKPVVEVVIQNDRAGLYGGEYASKNNSLTNARTGREQHSFHLHGHHFWLVGMGMGEWSPSKVGGPEYNLVNPPLRDTATVLFNGTTEDRLAWVAIRFVADNAGIWPLHCHIAWHQIMGQGLNVVVDPASIAKLTKPAGMPTCPKPCLYDFSNFNPKAVAAVYGSGSVPGAGSIRPGSSEGSSSSSIVTEGGSRDAVSMLAPDASNLP